MKILKHYWRIVKDDLGYELQWQDRFMNIPLCPWQSVEGSYRKTKEDALENLAQMRELCYGKKSKEKEIVYEGE